MRNDPNKPKRGLLAVGIIGLFLFVAAGIPAANPAHAAASLEETRIPESLSAGLDYLMGTVESGRSAPFDPKRIAKILEFVRAKKDDSALYYVDDLFDASSAYYEFDIQLPLSRVIELSHNPDLPSFLLMPSSVRLSHWTEIEGRRQPLPRLWPLLPNLERPVVVKGIEHIVNTPDINSGAYYGYNLKRALIIFKDRGRRVFLSISKQTDTSDVGRRGLVLGRDDDWNYLYSHRTGLARTGLGWVSSYMYDSFSVSVFDEIEPGRPLVRCGIFKWLRAGWARLNVVNMRHIYAGLDRYAKTFKEIIENPHLPDTASLERLFAEIEDLPLRELTSRVKEHFLTLKNNYAHDDNLSEEWVSDILANEQYLDTMKPAEKKSVLVVEELKKILRKGAPKIGRIP